MAIYGYTKNYKLIKPQFDTDTWHDYIYDNLDTIDAIMSAIYSSGNWQGFWKKNTHYDVGDVIIDQNTDTMYKVLVEHTTSENTFALEQAAHPTYYELWSPNQLAEDWAIKMDGLVSFTDYSAKAYAISSELIDAGSAKEWAVKTDGTIGTTGEYSAKKHATDASSSASTAIAQASAASASATLAQQWAVDANLVASTDYSSKSWATGSLDAGSAKDWAIKEGGQVGTTGKYSAKVYSLAAENHYEKARDWASKTNGQVESTDYSAKAYAISEGLISAGSAKEWSNKAKAWATSTTIVEDGKYGASYYALQAYNANVTAQIAKTTAQEWASKTDAQVASTDYSSKAYAQSEGLISTGSSKEWATKSATWAEGSDADVSALGGTHSAKGWADAAEDTYESVVGLIATPIGTIFQSIYVDESLDIARALNGQLISSTKFYGFRDWLDDVQTAHPSLFTTEVNWQAEVTNSVFGQCGKFVIDDENGTIRLPKVINAQGLMDLQYLGAIKSQSLPNITGGFSGIAYPSSGTSTSALYTSAHTYTGASNGWREYTAADAGVVNEQIDASRSSSAYQNNAPVQQEAIQYPYYIQVATGVEETLPAIREYKVNNSDFFGKSMYSDVAPDNASWLVSNGNYNAKSVYPDYYDWLLANVGETITANGGKVVLSTGTITDYDWVVNQSDETFRLPLLDGSENLPSSDYENVTPQATGSSYTVQKNCWVSSTGSNTGSVVLITNRIASTGSAVSGFSDGASNIFLKKGDSFVLHYNNTPSLQYIYAKGNGSLYYYVGDTVQDASLINAGQILNALGNKVGYDELTPVHAVVETYQNGNSWYRVYDDGWVEQGGVKTGAYANASETVYFLKNFANTNYTVVISSVYGSDYSEPAAFYGNDTVLGRYTDRFITPQSGNKIWFACGQGASL